MTQAPRKQRRGQQDSGEVESRPSPDSAHTPSVGLADGPVQALLDALLSGSDEALFEALRTHGVLLLPRARRGLLAAALPALPPAVRDGDPTILVLESMLCRLTMRYAEAIRLSTAAQTRLDDQGTDGVSPDAVDWISLMSLWRSRCGWADPHEAVARVRSRLGCRHGTNNVHTLGPGGSVVWSTWLMGELATVQIVTGDLDEAGLHLDEMIGNARVLGHDRMLAQGLAHRALLELVDGSYQTAAATARGSLRHAELGGSENVPHAACAHLVIGWADVQALDFPAARGHLEAAEAEPTLSTDPLLEAIARLLRIQLLAKEGSMQAARRMLAEHRPSPASEPPFLHRLGVLTSAQVVAMVNDTSAIRDHVITLAELGYLDDAELFEALAEAGDGRLDGALERLDDLLAQPRLHPAVASAAAAVRIGLLLRANRVSRANALLPDLLNRVAPQRMLLVLALGFLGGPAFRGLLEAEAHRLDGHPFAAEALVGLSGYVRPFPDLGSRTEAGVRLPLQLTPRERDVLVELSLGGSYADVAEAMFLSENTIKTHLTSAYRKLGVDRRVDALRVARENHVL
jgi:LuxR family transcriptional regulator, maltose regulon positive regulatory protein